MPLEHLITCAQDVRIQYNNENFYKYLQWNNNKAYAQQNAHRAARQTVQKPQRKVHDDLDLLYTSADEDHARFDDGEQENEAEGGESACMRYVDVSGTDGVEENEENDCKEENEEEEESQQSRIKKFAYEVIEMFKTVPRCIMSASKFYSEFQKKYGRHFRVADYGYTKIVELFEAIPHVLQIIDGEFEKKLTLTHSIQVSLVLVLSCKKK